jgi:aminopeptidase N
VLRQLAAYLGRDAFFAGISAYFAAHAWGNATLADLLAALEASSGRDLGEWSKAWLETAGPNTVRSEFETGPDGRFTAFAVRQEAPAEHPVLRPHHIAIGLYDRRPAADGTTELVRTHRVELDVNGALTRVPELVGLAQPDLILLNDDDLGYVIVRFDDRSLATLTEAIGEFTDALPRTICWGAVADMVDQTELSVPDFIRIVAAGLPSEQSVSVLQHIQSATLGVLRTLADPAQVPALKEVLAARAMELLPAAEPASDHQLAWAQLLASTAVTQEQLDVVAGLLSGAVQFQGLAIDPELRWSLLARLAATGRAGTAEIEAELGRDTTDLGRRSAFAASASIPDAGHKAAAWRLVVESTELGLEDSGAVARGFNQPEHAALLAPYVDAYFAQLPVIWENREGLLRMSLGRMLFPYSAASSELLARIETFLAEPGHDAAMDRAVIEGRDIVTKALRSRSLSQ